MKISNFKQRRGPDGIHIFDRHSGLNLLIDEGEPPREEWSAAPRQVSIALTNLCDLHCEYCYAPKHRACLQSEALHSWLQQLDDGGCIGIGFGGGEPTLHPEFVELCQLAALTTRLAVTFTTHGHRLTDLTLEKLAGSVHFIRISMDGYGSTYEALRRRSFDKLVDRIEATRKIVSVGINVVVNRSTVGDLSAIASLAADMGVAELLLLPEQPSNGSSGVDEITSARLRDWVFAYSGAVPLSISEAGAHALPTCNPLPKEVGLRAYAHVDANGTLKRSSYSGAGVKIGAGGILPALLALVNAEETSI